MVLSKDKKTEKINELKDMFSNSAASVAVCYSTLKANDITMLRKKMREVGITPVVTKNSLVKKALAEAKLEIDQTILDKPVLFGFGPDEVEISKILTDFVKGYESVEVLGGLVRGEIADSAKIKVLASLPSRQELQAKLVGTIAAPISGFVNVLSGNLRGLVNALNQISKQKTN
jgi:large subunit ribosomal protein L10